jgi:hypothetical protein
MQNAPAARLLNVEGRIHKGINAKVMQRALRNNIGQEYSKGHTSNEHDVNADKAI